MSAVHSNLMFVQNGNGGQGCGCGCDGRGQTIVFRSVWDRLVHQLFGSIPIGMVAEGQLPDIHIYKDNVVLLNDEEPYSFAVVTDDGSVPQPNDVIEYKDKFYVIGAVAQQGQSNASGSGSGSGSGTVENNNTHDPSEQGSPGSHDLDNPIDTGGSGHFVQP